MNNQTVLVTGGTGFVGIHSILQLLQQGYIVKTTLRTLSKTQSVIDSLKETGITDLSQLSFFKTDLTSDEGWDQAVEGCDYVLHVASPFPLAEPENENDLIIPARDGSLRVLKAARDAGVKRVVLTSSFAAIGYGVDRKGHVFDENDWTDKTASIPAYIKSKTVAEEAAWQFIKDQGEGMELTVINPVGIFGPIIGGIYPASFEGVIQAILDGKITENPPFTFGVVDVRDVADIHIKAMLLPDAAGQRFLATSEGAVSFYDVVELIKKQRPESASLIADLQPTAAEAYTKMSNKKAVETFNWHPRSKEEAILASVDTRPM
ncbi:aldehyde reductase [Dyadobacter flavalbus]|uniref:Aldehyde reductase n=1 Tax=Dyadobacter flavalbus TaxID=2579942 RepID=A0A5M8QS95_9BACT|nr:aldehyde reductase [Dyadobacter flavalbus]KAA6437062.1 aldehyde reductase [Dyadobacter flavalbus]